MTSVAVLITVFNRVDKTLACLDSIGDAVEKGLVSFSLSVFLTDDGSTDGTSQKIKERSYPFPVEILQGDGSLFWNGGMINSWKAALAYPEEFDGFLWLNNDTVVLPGFWQMLAEADKYAKEKYGKGQIYVGSTRDKLTGKFTYGGFNFVNKITLKDKLLPPNGEIQECQCAHGNITYVSREVVEKTGIFTNKYQHGGSDHDYTYRASRRGFHNLILPDYAGECVNDHPADGNRGNFFEMPLKKRIEYLKSPRGLNLHNALLFQKRCFPWRYPIIWTTGYFKALFPKTYHRLYLRARGVKG